MTEAQFREGVSYAEDNWKNENAPHLHVDKALIRRRFDLSGKKILDFGCGMGGMSLWYATNWPCTVHGVDIDPHHIEVARHLREKHHICNVEFEVRDVLKHPLSGKYDGIFMNDVAEHIPLPVLQEILQQMAGLLAPEGFIFVSYPPWKSPYASHLNHVIKIPWIQFFPKGMVDRLISRHNHPLVGDLEGDLRSAYHGLNQLTHERLTAIAGTAALRVTFRKSRSMVNRLPGLGDLNLRLPPFDYLITKEFLELKK
jgi:cyclopropane fatty-acyl-phospholipid synthase-like methyltransferase